MGGGGLPYRDGRRLGEEEEEKVDWGSPKGKRLTGGQNTKGGGGPSAKEFPAGECSREKGKGQNRAG